MSLLRFIAVIIMTIVMAAGCGQGKRSDTSPAHGTTTSNGATEVSAGSDNGKAAPDVATIRFPNDRPLSESVSPENLHEVLTAMANGEVGPGDLFASDEAREAFQCKVAGNKGWVFQPLSKENHSEYRVLVNGTPSGFLAVEGRRLDRGRYEIRQVGWWDERNEVEWKRIRWDNIPHVLNSVVLGEVPNAERLFTSRETYDKLKSLFPDSSWEFRVEARKGGIDVLLVDVIRNGKPSGTLTLSVGKAGIEDLDYEPAGS